jgi:hypothetical protein
MLKDQQIIETTNGLLFQTNIAPDKEIIEA